MRLLGVGTYVETRHDDRDDVVGQGVIDIVHDQSLLVTETRVGVDVGVNEWLSASVVVPVRVVSTAITYFDTAGDEVQLVNDGIHHRDEVVKGVADPMVLGAVSTVGEAGVTWTLRGGFTIPLGRTEEDPFALGDLGLAHQHIQMGTGTVNPVVSVDVAKSWGAWRVGGFAFTQQVVYENGKGYHAGDRYAGGVVARRGLGRAWGVRGGVEMQAETAEAWNGVMHTDDGNRGRIDAMLAVGASWAATSALTVDLGVKVPVITHVVGGQLDMPAIAEVGVAWTFGRKDVEVEEEHHHHEHDDGDDEHDHDEHEPAEPFVHPDTTGLDVQDVQEVAAVPGKITIVDFWATWCVPCKKLEPALVEIAKRNPDRVAIRRIDAVDWDSEVVARYLTPNGYGLPHVKVFDAGGKLVLEKSAEPGELESLIEAVRQIVEPGVAAQTETQTETQTGTQTQTETQTQTQTQTVKPVVKPRPVTVKIVVTDQGYEPSTVTVPRGKPVVLVFERKVKRTCATEAIFDADGKHYEVELPLDKPVTLRVTFKAAGTITYHCAMNMFRGNITVR